MKAMNFQDDFASVPVNSFKDDFVLVFDLTSTQDAIEHFKYPDLIGKPLRLELFFSSPLENAREVFVLGECMSSVAVEKFRVVLKNL